MSTLESRTAAFDTDPVTVGKSALAAGLLGLYAAWIAADVLPRWLVFVGVAAVGTAGLLTLEADRARIQTALYAFAGLLLVTPLFVVLPDLLQADAFGVGASTLLFMTVNLLLFAGFAVVAAVVAGVGYWVGGGS